MMSLRKFEFMRNLSLLLILLNNNLYMLQLKRQISYYVKYKFNLFIIPENSRHFQSDKRASLACAARLANTSCPPEAPFGRLEVTLVNYKGDIISKYVDLSFKIDITRKNTKFVNFYNFDE